MEILGYASLVCSNYCNVIGGWALHYLPIQVGFSFLFDEYAGPTLVDLPSSSPYLRLRIYSILILPCLHIVGENGALITIMWDYHWKSTL